MRVVHYLNQFFGGLGGEEQAGIPLQLYNGPIGPGMLLEQVFGGDVQGLKTLVCGDNYAVENLQALVSDALSKIRDAQADLFVAGPCFLAGRYGMAAGALCAAVQSRLGIPAVTGMAQENPGVDLYRESVYIVDSGDNAAKMREVLMRMAALALKLLRQESLGSPKAEGYIARGLIRDQFVAQTAGERLVDMVLAKVNGAPFESEMMPTTFAPIPMPPGVKDLKKAKVMLITDGGLVPKGNPDKIQGSAATRWGAYSIKNCVDLQGADYEISHGGYDAQFVRQDPDRLVPLDVMRDLEKEGAIGELCDEFLSTSGLANPLSNTRRMGREMAEKAKRLGIDAVILTST
ncbi:MAG TPA: glycine/betaine/sarcosine/D-proline family reductase selenoprotein B [Candidatus Limnocylindrales bacterium]|nr:glycine/betaine/sarcosine/D-proline family reductase selenoprotein B [Candidatus Limnocylindrales bacterium]